MGLYVSRNIYLFRTNKGSAVKYTGTTERRLTDDEVDDVRGFSYSAYCCIVLHRPLVSVNQPKEFGSIEDYHMVITSNISANRMARRLDENIEKCAGGGTVQQEADMEGVEL
jgi:hypothetical protein